MLFKWWLTRFKRVMSDENGVTLIEVIAALAISVMIGGALLSVVWPSMVRSLHLMMYTGAQRDVVLVNQALVKELHTADFVQVESGQLSTGQERIVLWLYKGYPQNVYNNNTISPEASLPWLYNTSSVVSTPSNSSALTIVSAKGAYGAFIFTQETSNATDWTVAYSANVNSMTTAPSSGVCSPSNLENVAQDAEFTKSNLGVKFYFPDVLSNNLNCKFVNSFIIRLSANYQTSTGQPATYSLTAGYHNRDVR